jgi:SDR family mycofactocin-dependent oxidoreductase
MRFIGRMERLAGKVAFITGAARGQGRAHAIRLASEGADVILADVCGPVESNEIRASSAEDLQLTVKEVESLGRRAVWGEVDVRDQAALTALVDRGVEELGHVDIVVANAAILNWARSHELTEEQWQHVIDVNLTGVFHTVQATLPHLLKQGTGGSYIITSSFAALKGTPFTLSYTAAKYGVIGIAKSIAHEYGDYNIRANTVHPCGVNTPMGGEADGLMALVGERASTVGPLFMNTLPVAMVEPEDIAATVAWLASDDAKYVTGAQIPVDAGAGDR